MSTEVLKSLLEKFRNGSLSETERRQLAGLLDDAGNRQELEAMIDEEIALTSGQNKGDEETMELIYQMIMQAKGEMKNSTSTKVIPLVQSQNSWKKIAVAASIILAIGIGSYFLFYNQPVNVGQQSISQHDKEVTAPKTTRAMITLADGRNIPVDSIANGMLAEQGNVKVVKNNTGEIIYSREPSAGVNGLIYNTLTNPRGSKIVYLILSDGTKIWLNSESSLRYPVVFTGDERKVEITGEVYFEVTHNTAQPFIVNVNNKGEVKVLGTHFNINAYENEPDIRVTLLEGSIKMNSGKVSKILKPGQQARVTNDVKIVNDVDPDEVMAWKNGQFNFRGANLQSIMNQLVRWYDVEVVYEGMQSMSLTGYVDKNVPLSQVLQLLESNGVRYRQEGAKIIMLK